jgi:hypothetical protein
VILTQQIKYWIWGWRSSLFLVTFLLVFTSTWAQSTEPVNRVTWAIASRVGGQHNGLEVRRENTLYHGMKHSYKLSHSIGVSLFAGDVFLVANNYRQSGSAGLYYSVENYYIRKENQQQVFRGVGLKFTYGFTDRKSWYDVLLGNPTSYNYTREKHHGNGNVQSIELYWKRGNRRFVGSSKKRYWDIGFNLGIRAGRVVFKPQYCNLYGPGGHVIDELTCLSERSFMLSPLVFNFTIAYGFQ